MKNFTKIAVLAVGLFVAAPAVQAGVSGKVKNLIKTSKQSFKDIQGAVAEVERLVKALKSDGLTIQDKIALCAQISDIIEDVLKIQVANTIHSAARVVGSIDKVTGLKMVKLEVGVRDMGSALEDITRVLRAVQTVLENSAKSEASSEPSTVVTEEVDETFGLEIPTGEKPEEASL